MSNSFSLSIRGVGASGPSRAQVDPRIFRESGARWSQGFALRRSKGPGLGGRALGRERALCCPCPVGPAQGGRGATVRVLAGCLPPLVYCLAGSWPPGPWLKEAWGRKGFLPPCGFEEVGSCPRVGGSRGREFLGEPLVRRGAREPREGEPQFSQR